MKKHKYKVGDKVVVVESQLTQSKYTQYLHRVSVVQEDPDCPDDPTNGGLVLLAFDEKTAEDPNAFGLHEIVPAAIYKSKLYRLLNELE